MKLEFSKYVSFILKHKTPIVISILFIINSVMPIFEDQLRDTFAVKTETITVLFIIFWALAEMVDKIKNNIKIENSYKCEELLSELGISM